MRSILTFGPVTNPKGNPEKLELLKLLYQLFPSSGTSPAIDQMKESLIFYQLNYAEFTDVIQHTPSPAVKPGTVDLQYNDGKVLAELNPGEPKFDQDGSALMVPWGRPQNDGPGMRTEILSKVAPFLKAHQTDSLIKNSFPS